MSDIYQMESRSCAAGPGHHHGCARRTRHRLDHAGSVMFQCGKLCEKNGFHFIQYTILHFCQFYIAKTLRNSLSVSFDNTRMDLSNKVQIAVPSKFLKHGLRIIVQ